MDFIITVIAVICAFIVKGLTGFANTLVFSTIMSFSASNINITPVELLVGYPSNLYIAWKERKGISPKVCLPLALLVIAGIIPGTMLLKYGDTGFIKTLFGCVVILLGIEMMLRERQKSSKKPSVILLVIIGVVSGLLCGLFGIGAFLVAYISRTTENQSQFKSNICVVFLAENTFRIILYSVTGIFHLEIIKNSLLLLPFMAAGLAIGMVLSKKMSDRVVKKTVIILLILSGLSIVINNIAG